MPLPIEDEDLENDDEDDIPDEIPARQSKALAANEDEEEEDDDEEPGEDEYHVEKIVDHMFDDDGTVRYQIKWLGYEAAEDMTWEPLENLAGAQEILEAYHKKIGGPPQPRSTKKAKGGKRSASDAFDTPTSDSSKKRGRKSNGTAETTVEAPLKRVLPQGSWEDHVLRIHSVIEETAPIKTTGKGASEEKQLLGLLQWKDGGPKTQHKMKILRHKCPQKLLDYYEQHLVFRSESKGARKDE